MHLYISTQFNLKDGFSNCVPRASGGPQITIKECTRALFIHPDFLSYNNMEPQNKTESVLVFNSWLLDMMLNQTKAKTHTQLGFNRRTHPSASSYLKLVHGDSGFNGLFQAFPGEMKYIISPVYPGEIIYYILYISFVYLDINKSDIPNKNHYSLKGQITNPKKRARVCSSFPLSHQKFLKFSDLELRFLSFTQGTYTYTYI